MSIVELGKYRMTPVGDYNPSNEYKYLDVVYFNNASYVATELNGAIAGETPSSALGKWQKLADGSVLSFGNNVVLYTDNNGDVQELPLTAGNLNYDGSTLAFVPDVTPVTVRRANKLQENTSTPNYGMAYIANDDLIMSAGYYTSNVVHNSPLNTHNNKPQAIPMDGDKTGQWAGVYAGYYVLYAWTTTGELWVMGYNGYGQLGLGDTTQRNVLTKTTMTDVIEVKISGEGVTSSSAYALTSTGKVFSCGYNGYGQLGLGTTTTTNVWTEITGYTGSVVGISDMSSHQYASFGLYTNASSDNLWVCGYNGYGQLGLSNTTTQNTLQNVPFKVKQIMFHGRYSSYASSTILLESGEVRSCGRNAYGESGTNNTTQYTVFTPLEDPFTGFTEIGGQDAHAGVRHGIDGNKNLHLWGYNGYGAQGTGDTAVQTKHQVPTAGFQGKVVKVSHPDAYNGAYTIVLDSDGKLWHSGYAGNYQTGTGSSVNTNMFAEIPNPITGSTVVDFMIGGVSTSSHINALLSTGEIISWGYNGHGQCAFGATGGAAAKPVLAQM